MIFVLLMKRCAETQEVGSTLISPFLATNFAAVFVFLASLIDTVEL